MEKERRAAEILAACCQGGRRFSRGRIGADGRSKPPEGPGTGPWVAGAVMLRIPLFQPSGWGQLVPLCQRDGLSSGGPETAGPGLRSAGKGISRIPVSGLCRRLALSRSLCLRLGRIGRDWEKRPAFDPALGQLCLLRYDRHRFASGRGRRTAEMPRLRPVPPNLPRRRFEPGRTAGPEPLSLGVDPAKRRTDAGTTAADWTERHGLGLRRLSAGLPSQSRAGADENCGIFGKYPVFVDGGGAGSRRSICWPYRRRSWRA